MSDSSDFDSPRSSLRHAILAALLYAVLACALTWPLVTTLSGAIPQAKLDPLLNCWILAWDAERLSGIVAGRGSDALGFWQANTFHPAPDALAYSEHLVAQALQILPVYALTRNVVLAYNLLFLSTFILSGLGVFLLVRELFHRTAPAVLAGLFYAFLPYRVDQFGHLQVLSSQWMPFVLYGIVRYLSTARRRPLAGAAVALILQNLSRGYYLLFFAPFLALFVVFELHRRGRMTDARIWGDLLAAGVVVCALTLPFLLPYARLRARGEVRRSTEEVVSYSADLWSYRSAGQDLRFWGPRLGNEGRSEGQLFLGFTPLLVTIAGAAWAFVRRGRGRLAGTSSATLALLGVASTAFAVAIVAALGAIGFGLGPLTVRVHDLSRPLALALLALAAALASSPPLRHVVIGLSRSVACYCAAAFALAVWLSLGPVVRGVHGPVPLFGLYRLLYEYVPGYDGLRVPARMAMLAGLFLSVLGGWAASQLEGGRPRVLAAVAGGLFLVEATPAPIALDPPPSCSAIYADVRQLPAHAVVAELPFGDPYDEARYTFCSTKHWRKIMNGYSGAFPEAQAQRSRALHDVLRDPKPAWQALISGGATHVLVHGEAWRGNKLERLGAWLKAQGARLRSTRGADALWELP